jgi:hypothetical protein
LGQSNPAAALRADPHLVGAHALYVLFVIVIKPSHFLLPITLPLFSCLAYILPFDGVQAGRSLAARLSGEPWRSLPSSSPATFHSTIHNIRKSFIEKRPANP